MSLRTLGLYWNWPGHPVLLWVYILHCEKQIGKFGNICRNLLGFQFLYVANFKFLFDLLQQYI